MAVKVIKAPLDKPSIVPTGWVLLIRCDTIDKTTKSGLVIIPDSVRDLTNAAAETGIVCAIGPLAWKRHNGEPWCNVGDRIFFGKYAGYVAKDPKTDVTYRLITDEDVMGVIPETGGINAGR